MKKIILFIFLVMILLCAACSSENDNGIHDNPTNSNVNNSKTEVFVDDETDETENVNNEETKTSVEDLKEDFATVGQFIDGDDFKISLLYVKEFENIKDPSGYFDETPASGKIYLVLFFEVISKKEDVYINTFYFDAYVDDYKVSNSIIINKPDGFGNLSGHISTNQRIKGCMVYEVSSEWQKFEITYDSNVWISHNEAKFTFEKDQVAESDYVYNTNVFGEYSIPTDEETGINSTVKNVLWDTKIINIIESKTFSEGYLTSEAEEGYVYVVILLEVKNISSEDDYFNSLYFDCYVDGYSTNLTSLLLDVDGISNSFGGVASGKKIKGYIALEIPENWSSIEIVYRDNSNEKLEYLILN